MGLLDSVLGSVLSGQQAGGAGGLAGVLGSVLGGQAPSQDGQGGGLGGINPALLATLAPIVLSMLSNNSQSGGLGGLIDKFTQAGAGDAVASWLGTGSNQPVSGEQVTQALGSDTVSQIASQLGVDHGEAASGIAAVLPALVDKLTPNGQAPSGGLGSADDIVGMLGRMLQK